MHWGAQKHNCWDLFKSISKFNKIFWVQSFFFRCSVSNCVKCVCSRFHHCYGVFLFCTRCRSIFARLYFHTSQSYVAQNNLATALSLLNQLLSTSQNTLVDTTHLQAHKLPSSTKLWCRRRQAQYKSLQRLSLFQAIIPHMTIFQITSSMKGYPQT